MNASILASPARRATGIDDAQRADVMRLAWDFDAQTALGHFPSRKQA
jgi:hypothetical protein